MVSSLTAAAIAAEREAQPPAELRWRVWPLADYRRRSWVAPLSVLAVGGVAVYMSGSWTMGIFAIAVIALSLWQFWFPVTFEIDAQGLRRRCLGRTRLVPWRAIRAYQPRTTGIVLFQRPDPTPIDALRSIFVPYSDDEDETLCSVRQYLTHAIELPQ